MVPRPAPMRTMKRWMITITATLALTACQPDDDGMDGDNASNTTTNAATSSNNDSTGDNNATDGATNNATDGATNNATDGATNNATTSGEAWWKPAPGTSWQWQISGEVDTSIDVAMYDVDLFDVPQETIDALHADGRVVVCYFSAGTYEDWRPDADEFEAADYGNELPDWPGEYWVDVRSDNVRRILGERLDLAVDKQCDGVEPDNVDGVSNNPGFDFSPSDQIAFNRFLAQEAHDRGLSVGLKNALELVPQLQPDFDWALNEECLSYDECDTLRPFLDAGKAVFHTEYVDAQADGPAKRDEVCPSRPAEFSTLIKTWDLDAWYLACD